MVIRHLYSTQAICFKETTPDSRKYCLQNLFWDPKTTVEHEMMVQILVHPLKLIHCTLLSLFSDIELCSIN